MLKLVFLGGCDSTKSDILVEGDKKQFYIEVKQKRAQCAQFVLLKELDKFIYSSGNKNELNQWSQQIIDYINAHIDDFKDLSTKNKNINLSKDIFVNYIIDFYKKKGVKYIMTDNCAIIPIDKFGDYFDVSANFRIKKSGSRNLPKKEFEDITTFLKLNYDTKKVIIKENKLLVEFSDGFVLHNPKFKYNNEEYIFSNKENIYEIRKLSNTNNANVIFSIKYNGKEGIKKEDFINNLK